jgi:DNA (cytosine-5)-methyltransferase 1
MRVVHGSLARARSGSGQGRSVSYYDRLITRLDGIGYAAEGHLLRAADFGVPQLRPRLVVVGLRKHIANGIPGGIAAVFRMIESARLAMLEELGLSPPVSASDALSDLVAGRRRLIGCVEPDSPKGFSMIQYLGPKTAYQRLMHQGMGPGQSMDSMRLAQHSPRIAERFRKILKNYPKGVGLSERARAELKMSKHRTCAMKSGSPSPTLTTLPDDLLHYREPRILTVREMARLQSFPDWFRFRGKYTTGGHRRKTECPRYSQVGNAVPPLMGRAIGTAMLSLLGLVDTASERVSEGGVHGVSANVAHVSSGERAWIPT